jgi:Transposase DDE domain group 1
VQSTTGSRPRVVVSADGREVVGHAGTRLLADVAEVAGLAGGFGDALAVLRRRRSGHDPGRVALDVAVMLADGGEAIADLAVLRGQPELFGPVASDATVWRVLDSLDEPALARMRAARAAAREVAWAQAAETGGGVPASTAGGRRARVVRCPEPRGVASVGWWMEIVTCTWSCLVLPALSGGWSRATLPVMRRREFASGWLAAPRTGSVGCGPSWAQRRRAGRCWSRI